MYTKMSKHIVFDMTKIFASSVSAVLPENLIRRFVNYNPSSQQLTINGDNFCLRNKNVYLVGSGKAVQNMAKEVESILSGKIKRGIISLPVGSRSFNSKNENIFYCEGALNNLPDANALNTAKAIRDQVMSLGCDDLLLVLLSGGGSALMPLPKPPITLEEKTKLIKQLANSGAEITELNTVRKRISDLKGGQLAIKAQPAQVISLLLSDIVGDPIDFLASGPTTENTDKKSDAIDIINKYKLMDKLPESIRTVLNTNGVEEQFPCNNVKNYIIGSNKIAIAAALDEARKLNYLSFPLSNEVTGNVKEVAFEYVKLTQHACEYLSGKISLDELRQCVMACNIPGIHEKHLADLNIPKDMNLCLVLGGEITVNVKGSGKGGRNQQLALEFSECIHNKKNEFKNFDVHFLSAGTDGIDGPTDAAGAIGHLNLISDAIQKNIDYKKYLSENDSYNFYHNHFDGKFHVITGHTNTNVMDIHIIVITRDTKDE